MNFLFMRKVLKNIIFDPGRLKRLNQKQIEKFRDYALKKMVKYAFTVPLYHDIYKKNGIHPRNINGKTSKITIKMTLCFCIIS